MYGETTQGASVSTSIVAVTLASELYGETIAVGHNISAIGMIVQSADVLPLGSVVTVHFRIADSDDEIIARAEVKHHLCFTRAIDGIVARGMWLCFVDFDDQLPLSLPATRVMH